MNAAHANKIVSELSTKYSPNSWSNNGVRDIDQWISELTGLSGDHIKHGFSRLKEKHDTFPPTPMQFRGLCESYSAGHGSNLSYCKAKSCPVQTVNDYCSYHPYHLTQAETRTVTQGLINNEPAVKFVLHINQITAIEFADPKANYEGESFYNWPEEMLDMWETWPPGECEGLGAYRLRIAGMVNQLILPKPSRTKPEPVESKPKPRGLQQMEYGLERRA